MSENDYPIEDGQSDDDIAAEIESARSGDSAGHAEGADRLAIIEAENAELKDRLLRLAADLENTRKRSEREKIDAGKYAIANFARDLLSVADNFERALAAVPAQGEDMSPEAMESLVAGVRMTDTELLNALQRHGVKRLSPKGEKFDPNCHQAVAQAPSDVPSGHVADVAQTGFMIGDRVLRAAMVVVSTGGGKEAEKAEQAYGANELHSSAGASLDKKV